MARVCPFLSVSVGCSLELPPDRFGSKDAKEGILFAVARCAVPNPTHSQVSDNISGSQRIAALCFGHNIIGTKGLSPNGTKWNDWP